MKTLKYIGAQLLWLVNALFGLWLVFISRNTWLTIFDRYYINGSPTRATRAGLFDRVLSIILGIAWFLVIIALQSYLSNGVGKDDLLRRFAKATAPIVLGFSAVDLVLVLIQGAAIVGWLRWLIILAGLILGITLVRLGWFKTVSLQKVGQASGAK